MPTLKKSAFLDTVAFCDPAGGKENKDATKARSAVVVVSQDAAARIFVRHAWAERCSTEALLNHIAEVHHEFAPKPFGIEANAQQSLFVDAAILHFREQGLPVAVAPILQPTSINKDFRIRAVLQPVFAQHRIFLSPAHSELRKEIKNFPMSTIKDLIDALASAVNLLPRRMTLTPATTSSDAHLAYLRNTGAPPEYIQRIHDQYRLEASVSTVTDIDEYLARFR